jgi:hypothetical protein
VEENVIELPPTEYVHRSFYLSSYDRYVDLTITIFGGMRFCLSGKGTHDFYDLNWCMGKMDLTNQLMKVMLVALENNIKLPSCSTIKPLHNDQEFLNHIENLTGIKIIEL